MMRWHHSTEDEVASQTRYCGDRNFNQANKEFSGITTQTIGEPGVKIWCRRAMIIGYNMSQLEN